MLINTKKITSNRDFKEGAKTVLGNFLTRAQQ